MAMLVEVSAGELLDKITILELKVRRVTSSTARANIDRELGVLRQAYQGAGLDRHPLLQALIAQLRAVNTMLWDVEDALRDCERRRDFGAEFVKMARAVYHNNDRRSAVKRRINEVCGSALCEEKLYASYEPEASVMSAETVNSGT